MAKTLQRVGNSLAVIIDAPIRRAVGIWTPLLYAGRAESWSKGDAATDSELQSLRRMEACLLALQAGRSWDEAIELALEQFPRCSETKGVE